MPNHITNTLKIKGKDSDKVLEEILNEERQLDFELVLKSQEAEKENWYKFLYF